MGRNREALSHCQDLKCFQPAAFLKYVLAVYNINLPNKKKKFFYLKQLLYTSEDNTTQTKMTHSHFSTSPSEGRFAVQHFWRQLQFQLILQQVSFQIQISQRRKPQWWDKLSEKCNFFADFMAFAELKKCLIVLTVLVCVLKQLEDIVFITL